MTSALLNSIMETSSDAIITIDTKGLIQNYNFSTNKMFGYSGEELLGQNINILMSDVYKNKHDHFISNYLKTGETKVLGFAGRRLSGLRKDGNELPIELLIDQIEIGGQKFFTGIIRDVSENKLTENKNFEQKKLLELTQKCLTDYMGKGDFKEISENLLLALLEITNCEYGFMGEVLYNDLGKRYLKTHAISNISWDESSQKFYDENSLFGLEFSNLDTLFGEVLKTSKLVISNTPSEDSRAGGLPEGHPALNSFLGVPIYYGDVFIGMYGLANRKGGFDEALSEFLEPYSVSYGVILNARRADTENKERAKELYKAKKTAEQANKAKSQFLSSMSHELRTPLNAVIGFSQVLNLNPNDLSENQRSNVTEILNAGNHLLSLINDVLELTKIEAGRVDLNIEPVNLKLIQDECIELILPLANAKNITVKYDSKCDLEAVVLVDKVRVRQVLLNLLSNAVKYNVEGGSVKVNCESLVDNNYYRLSVKDTGKGIAEEYHDSVFTEFERLGEEVGSIEGSGIGLTITKDLVELMGGSIGFESKKDQGSTFWIDLLSANSSQGIAAYAGEKELKLNALAAKPKLIKNTFLYIEDNPANLRLVVEMFKHFKDAKLEGVHDSLLGLDIARTIVPKLILLDINMPNLNGYEVLEQLRQDEITKDIPVIAVSADVLPKNIERALEAGFNDYLTKPLDVDNFFKVIQSYIE